MMEMWKRVGQALVLSVGGHLPPNEALLLPPHDADEH